MSETVIPVEGSPAVRRSKSGTESVPSSRLSTTRAMSSLRCPSAPKGSYDGTLTGFADTTAPHWSSAPGEVPWHPAPTLLAKSRLLCWYRYSRVDYDFAAGRWTAT